MRNLLLDVSSKEGYDIATALRGPDSHAGGDPSFYTKLLTASVIRHFAGCIQHTALNRTQIGYVYTPADAKYLWNNMATETQAKVRDFMRINTHFMSHVYNGLRAFKTPEADVYLDWLFNNVSN